MLVRDSERGYELAQHVRKRQAESKLKIKALQEQMSKVRHASTSKWDELSESVHAAEQSRENARLASGECEKLQLEAITMEEFYNSAIAENKELRTRCEELRSERDAALNSRQGSTAVATQSELQDTRAICKRLQTQVQTSREQMAALAVQKEEIEASFKEARLTIEELQIELGRAEGERDKAAQELDAAREDAARMATRHQRDFEEQSKLWTMANEEEIINLEMKVGTLQVERDDAVKELAMARSDAFSMYQNQRNRDEATKCSIMEKEDDIIDLKKELDTMRAAKYEMKLLLTRCEAGKFDLEARLKEVEASRSSLQEHAFQLQIELTKMQDELAEVQEQLKYAHKDAAGTDEDVKMQTMQQETEIIELKVKLEEAKNKQQEITVLMQKLKLYEIQIAASQMQAVDVNASYDPSMVLERASVLIKALEDEMATMKKEWAGMRAAKLSSARATVERVQKDAKAKLEEYREALARLTEELRKCKKDLMMLQQAKTEEEHKNRELQAVISELRDAALREKNSVSSSQVAEVLEAKDNQMRQLQRDLAAAQNAFQAARRQVDEQETRAREAEADVEAMRQHLDAVVGEKHYALNAALSNIEEEREQVVKDIAAAQSVLATAREEAEVARSELTKHVVAMEGMQNLSLKDQASIVELQKELAGKSEAMAVKTRQLEKLSVELSDQRQMYVYIHTQLKVAEEALAAKESAMHILSSKLQNVSETLAAKNSEQEQQAEMIAAQERKLESAADRAVMEASERKKLEVSVKALQDQLARLAAEPSIESWNNAKKMTMILDIDYNSIQNHEAFKEELVRNIASAAKVDHNFFKVVSMRAGSVIVDLLIAPEVGDQDKIAQDLAEQAHDPNSPLRTRTLTSSVRSIAATEALDQANRDEKVEHLNNLLEMTESARARVLQDLVNERKIWASERASLQSQTDVALASEKKELAARKELTKLLELQRSSQLAIEASDEQRRKLQITVDGQKAAIDNQNKMLEHASVLIKALEDEVATMKEEWAGMRAAKLSSARATVERVQKDAKAKLEEYREALARRTEELHKCKKLIAENEKMLAIRDSTNADLRKQVVLHQQQQEDEVSSLQDRLSSKNEEIAVLKDRIDKLQQSTEKAVRKSLGLEEALASKAAETDGLEARLAELENLGQSRETEASSLTSEVRASAAKLAQQASEIGELKSRQREAENALASKEKELTKLLELQRSSQLAMATVNGELQITVDGQKAAIDNQNKMLEHASVLIKALEDEVATMKEEWAGMRAAKLSSARATVERVQKDAKAKLEEYREALARRTEELHKCKKLIAENEKMLAIRDSTNADLRKQVVLHQQQQEDEVSSLQDRLSSKNEEIAVLKDRIDKLQQSTEKAVRKSLGLEEALASKAAETDGLEARLAELENLGQSRETEASSLTSEVRASAAKLAQQASEIGELKSRQREAENALASKEKELTKLLELQRSSQLAMATVNGELQITVDGQKAAIDNQNKMLEHASVLIKALEDEVATMKEEWAGMRAAKLSSARATVERVQKDAKAKLEEYREALARRTEELHKCKKLIAENEKMLAIRDSTNADLRKQVVLHQQQQEDEVSSLQDRLSSKNEEIAVLKDRIDKLQQSTEKAVRKSLGLEEALASKAAETDGLEARLAELENLGQSRETEASSLTSEVRASAAKLAQQASEIGELKSRQREAENALASKEKELTKLLELQRSSQLAMATVNGELQITVDGQKAAIDNQNKMLEHASVLIKALEDEVATMKEEWAGMRAAKLSSARATVERVQKDAKAKLEEYREALARRTEELHKCKKLIAENEKMLAIRDSTNADLRKQVVLHQQQQEDEVSSLQDRLSSKNEEIAVLKDRIDKLQQSTEKAVRKSLGLEEALASKAAETDGLEARLAELENLGQSRETEASSLTSEVRASAAKLAQQASEIGELKSRQREAENALASKEKELTKLLELQRSSQLAMATVNGELQITVDGQKAAIDNQNKMLEHASVLIKALEDEVATMKEEWAGMRAAKLSSARATVERVQKDAKAKLEEYREALARRTEELHKCKKLIAENEKMLAIRDSTNADLRKQVVLHQQQQEDEVSSLQDRLSSKNEEIAVLKDRIDKLQQSTEKAVRKSLGLEEALASKAAETDGLEARLAELENLGQSRETEASSLTSEVRASAAKLAQQASEIGELKSRQREAENALASKEKELTKLLESLTRRTEELHKCKQECTMLQQAEKEMEHKNCELQAVISEFRDRMQQSAASRAKEKNHAVDFDLDRAVQLVTLAKELVAKEHWCDHSQAVLDTDNTAAPIKNQTTVGIAFDGKTCVIENVLVGGPAFNSKKVFKGDKIVSIDSVPVEGKDIIPRLKGSDAPGSVVVVGLQKRHSSNVEQVKLRRMENTQIADKRQIFELFTKLIDTSRKRRDKESEEYTTEALDLWTAEMLEQYEHDQMCIDNLHKMQSKTDTWLEELLRILKCSEQGEIKRSAAPLVSEDLEEAIEAKDNQIKQLQRDLAAAQNALQLARYQADEQEKRARQAEADAKAKLEEYREALARLTEELRKCKKDLMMLQQAKTEEEHKNRELQAVISELHDAALREKNSVSSSSSKVAEVLEAKDNQMRQLQRDLAAAQNAFQVARRQVDEQETLAGEAEADVEAMRQHLDAVIEERENTLKAIHAAVEHDRQKAIDNIRRLEEQVEILSAGGGADIVGQAVSSKTRQERLQRFRARMLLKTVFCAFGDWRYASKVSLLLLKVSWLQEELAEKSALLQGAVLVTNSLAQDVKFLQDHVVQVIAKARQALSLRSRWQKGGVTLAAKDQELQRLRAALQNQTRMGTEMQAALQQAEKDNAIIVSKAKNDINLTNQLLMNERSTWQRANRELELIIEQLNRQLSVLTKELAGERAKLQTVETVAHNSVSRIPNLSARSLSASADLVFYNGSETDSHILHLEQLLLSSPTKQKELQQERLLMTSQRTTPQSHAPSLHTRARVASDGDFEMTSSRRTAQNVLRARVASAGDAEAMKAPIEEEVRLVHMCVYRARTQTVYHAMYLDVSAPCGCCMQGICYTRLREEEYFCWYLDTCASERGGEGGRESAFFILT
jgi:chromosome segregation ATPase